MAVCWLVTEDGWGLGGGCEGPWVQVGVHWMGARVAVQRA